MHRFLPLLTALAFFAAAQVRAVEIRLQHVERFGVAHPEQVVEVDLAQPLTVGDRSAVELKVALSRLHPMGRSC